MPGPPPSLRRGPRERFEAWLVTGPLGHLWSVVADVGAFALKSLGGYASERLRRER